MLSSDTLIKTCNKFFLFFSSIIYYSPSGVLKSTYGVRKSVMNMALDWVQPNTLFPHPQNYSIYGETVDVSDLVDLIAQSGWIKPLVITPAGTIISGHRRWKAALKLGLESISVEVREFSNGIAELEALLLENASRFKTIEQKVREAEAWTEVERIKAKDRQGTRTDIQENFPGCEEFGEKGQVRDLVAHRVGLGSSRNYEKAAAVVREIDQLMSNTPETAVIYRKVLNEQSVDAAHRLLKKPFSFRQQILLLLSKGKAKSAKQAELMVQQNKAEYNDSFREISSTFAEGDWVEINAEAQTCIGLKGQVEQILSVEQQISVNFEGGPSKIKFYPHELTLIAKVPPPCPFGIGDIVFIDIDREEAVSPHEKKWNTFWGQVRQIGERGSLTVDVGSELLQLFPRDLKPLDTPIQELRHVVERVLRLRQLKLDEVEERILDVIQQREWLTGRQLDCLDFVEKFYLLNELSISEDYQVAQCRGP